MDLIRSLSATSVQTFVKIRFPTAMPHIFVGLKIAITFAVIGAVIGEFVGSENGLGYLILVSTSQSRTTARLRLAVAAHGHEHRALLRHRAHRAPCRAMGPAELRGGGSTSWALTSAAIANLGCHAPL